MYVYFSSCVKVFWAIRLVFAPAEDGGKMPLVLLITLPIRESLVSSVLQQAHKLLHGTVYCSLSTTNQSSFSKASLKLQRRPHNFLIHLLFSVHHLLIQPLN